MRRRLLAEDLAVATARDIILEELSETYDVSPREVLSKRRIYKVVAVRWLLIKRLSELGYGVAAIGRAVGRDHSTVIHALKSLRT